MRRKKKQEEAHENHERWLLSYSDFITLLMIFFIIMYAMSNLDKEKYQKVATGLQHAMGGSGGGGSNIIGIGGEAAGNGEVSPIDTGLVNMSEDKKFEQVKLAIEKYLKEAGLSDSVVTDIEERGLVLSFKDSLFFDSGKADIKQEQIKKLVDIGKILNQPLINESYIRVEGHTDNIPMYSNNFKSNWDLSVIRASNVTQTLINESGIRPDRISPAGYGEYRPKAENTTPEGRAINRRVDILIMNTKFNEVENNKK